MSIGKSAKTGQAKSKPDGMMAASRTIDKTLAKKQRLTILPV